MTDHVGRDNLPDIECLTSLQVASYHGHIEVVKILLDAGADINATSVSGDALYHAAQKGRTKVAELLLDKGADLSATRLERQGFTSVFGAVIAPGHPATLEMFLLRGADSNATCSGESVTNRTLLHEAAFNESVDCAAVLLRHGANLNAKDSWGKTPLHYAAQEDREETVRLFLKKGSEINNCDEDGLTPLMFAALKGSLKTLKLLLDRGADDAIEATKYLLDGGADIDTRDFASQTPLMKAAARSGHVPIMELLMNRGVISTTRDKYNSTAMHYAAAENSVDAVEYLLNLGVGNDPKNIDSFTPLMFAASDGHLATGLKVCFKVYIEQNLLMDPITAVGFAASILTFIDFSYEIIYGTYEVTKSGRTTENAHLSVVTKDLDETTKELSQRPPGDSKHEEALNTLATECGGVSDELRKLLDCVKTKAGSSKWRSIKVALHSMWEERRDHRVGQQTCERQVAVQVELNNFQSLSQKQASYAVKQLTNLRDDVLKSVESKIQDSNQSVSLELSDQLRLIKDIRNSVDTLLALLAVPSPDMRVLKQLYFNAIYAREDAMEKAASGTFEWILKEDSSDNEQNSKSEDDDDDSEIEDDELAMLVEDTKKIQSESRIAFLIWLREENRVFHISGKAGSGKSTLIKFLVDHPQTRVELKKWAEGKQLIFAHFFFWRSGVDKLQRSLSGLYRSILFEVLKQFPDLIREVFPEAYAAFSKNGPGGSIDELFFRPRNLENSMKLLISKSPFPGYRFCFFIDGLDEYGEDGADGLDHEDLAKDLKEWATKDDIKILVSSRPHREFQEAFSEDRRIRLHRLTKPDIFRFGRNMFREHKCFLRVRYFYKELVAQVVYLSDGVFLWARLAIRSLLMAAWRMAPGRKDAEDYLEKQLENLPTDNINALYENILASILPGDRQKAFKMLLLVAEMSELTAVSLTWIDQLDDPAFPTSYEIKPYTDDEIKERQATAESEVGDFTKGLLEITEPSHQKDNLFFCKSVQFFHRTLRDFVRQSKQLRDFSTEFPDLVGFETRTRVCLAELWFVKSEYVTRIPVIYNLFYKYPCRPSRDAQLDSFERVLSYHIQAGYGCLRGITAYPDRDDSSSNEKNGTFVSFIHFVTWCLNDVEYVRRRVTKKLDLLQAKDDLSLIVSASLAWEGDSAMLKMLLDLGASPNEQVKVKDGSHESIASPWMVFCTYFATIMIYKEEDKYKARLKDCLCGKLEHFLATGVVDTNCVILMAQARNPRAYKGHPTHSISLKQLVQQLEPDNGESLLKMMNGPREGMLATLRDAWRYLTSSESGSPSTESAYLPFDVSMQPPSLSPEDGIGDKGHLNPYKFFVHSVKWGDTQLTAANLQIRFY
ncbi:hypothetical protein G7Y89_g13649 [Cudoniella acicularis]|uniref:NACHT domain-containing protein n=1 Tax=Cudoniella acicularis TaxID=354080 RepID=A0A8H4VVU5_9HELO|nr:hypothetical protein G7Y89_g13649 [Cudoniella acicularis]